MASTSRSPGMDDIPLKLDGRDDPQPHPKHTIFLCHSGAQKPFVEQLFVDLKRRGQSPFFDQCTDSLQKGAVFAERIFEAAKQCVVAVVVLSKEFLVSKWAMLELSAFVTAQQTRNPNLKLFPLFYKLEVSDLKDAEATRAMEKWVEMAAADDRIDLEVWKNAVRVLAGANGEVFSKYGGSEVKYRKAIVNAVCKLCRPYVAISDPSLVGRDQLCKIMGRAFEKLATDRGITAKILGVYGVGGMGKTFICKAVRDHFSDEYSRRVCYVEYSDGKYLELLKFILKELTDIDKKTLERITSEEQANDSLKRFLPKQDVFLAIDNVQDDHLDWPFLTYLSGKSKVVVASRSLVNVQRVVGSQALCLPCPTLTQPEALKLFVQSVGCTQPLAEWTNEETEILKECIELSFFKNEMPDGETEILMKCIELSLSENGSGSSRGSSLNSDLSEKRGYYNPLVLVAMGTTVKGDNTLQPKQLMEKCKLIKRLQQYERRKLSDVLKAPYEALTADEKLLFRDVALFYPITNLGDVEFVDMLDRLMLWLQTLEGSPRRQILQKLGNLTDFNRVWNGHKKVHELFANICLKLGLESMYRWNTDEVELSMHCLNKVIEIFTLEEASTVSIDERDKGLIYMTRGMERLTLGDRRGALEDLQKASNLHPNHARIYQLLGTARSGLGRYPEALEALNWAIALYHPPVGRAGFDRAMYVDSLATRALVKLELNDLAGAKMDIDYASTIDPHCASVQAFRPMIYASLSAINQDDIRTDYI